MIHQLCFPCEKCLTATACQTCAFTNSTLPVEPIFIFTHPNGVPTAFVETTIPHSLKDIIGAMHHIPLKGPNTSQYLAHPNITPQGIFQGHVSVPPCHDFSSGPFNTNSSRVAICCIFLVWVFVNALKNTWVWLSCADGRGGSVHHYCGHSPFNYFFLN